MKPSPLGYKLMLAILILLGILAISTGKIGRWGQELTGNEARFTGLLFLLAGIYGLWTIPKK
jgi:hypothetical protein